MSFRLGITRDVLDARGEPSFGAAALEVLKGNPALEWEYLPEAVAEITPEIAARYDAVYVNSPKVGAAAVARADCRVRLFARHGVGYDSVDVAAMTAKGILVTNTPVAVRRPVAVASLTMLFALAGNLFAKDRLTRAGKWMTRTSHMGLGLIGRTLGIVGAGGIGQELLRVAQPFGMKLVVADPFVDESILAPLNAVKKPLEAMLAEADFVIVTCLLNEATFHLIGAAQFARMKPSAFLINMARGPVVDEAALIEALRAKRIAGAGLDVFEQEPVDPQNPLLTMDNVIVTPHALCWTDQCFHDIASQGLQSVVDFSLGKRPAHPVDPAAWKGKP
ncbi:MAG: NAD(P)-dependent oxidoreductase [Proteobacteria bacterium]|nr:NAD(P)-dependent oxidoreductase [Pseudomonadota bacterium]